MYWWGRLINWQIQHGNWSDSVLYGGHMETGRRCQDAGWGGGQVVMPGGGGTWEDLKRWIDRREEKQRGTSIFKSGTKETAERVQQTAAQTTFSLVFLKHEVQQKEWDERTGEVRTTLQPCPLVLRTANLVRFQCNKCRHAVVSRTCSHPFVVPQSYLACHLPPAAASLPHPSAPTHRRASWPHAFSFIASLLEGITSGL